MTFVPIRDIQLTKDSLAALAERAGDADTAALFREPGNPSIVRNGRAWAAAQHMFYATTARVHGKFDPGYNLSDHADFQYLPGKKWDNFYDPEGFLSTIPAVATCLLGVFAGFLLRNPSVPDQRKVAWLIGAGVVAAAVGWLWGLQFPVIKKIWTSSYVLVAGGYSAILLGVFYLIVDVWHLRRWCQPFVWIGMNSITIYLTKNILDHGFNTISTRLVGGDVKVFFDTYVTRGFGEMMITIVGLLVAFWYVRFLYQRKIFLRL
jgi:predicted acyltransferase